MDDLVTTLTTKRLILRPWKESDLAPFAALNADPRVMEFFPSPLSRQESDALAKRIYENIEKQSWGLWAVSIPSIADFIGFIGLAKVPYEAPFTPAIEIGWRLAFDHWNKGYATEGAKEALRYGFQELMLDEIVSITFIKNRRSRKVMEKIGLHHHPGDDFDHPRLIENHPLKRHVLYRLKAQEWALKNS